MSISVTVTIRENEIAESEQLSDYPVEVSGWDGYSGKALEGTLIFRTSQKEEHFLNANFTPNPKELSSKATSVIRGKVREIVYDFIKEKNQNG